MKVGDYVRTKEFGINKVKWFDNEEPILENGFTALQSSGYKSSPNIIDLIEVGDYVNGNPVCLIKEDEHNRKWIYTDSNYKCGYLEEDIETILTHEQFDKWMYKVGDIDE